MRFRGGWVLAIQSADTVVGAGAAGPYCSPGRRHAVATDDAPSPLRTSIARDRAFSLKYFANQLLFPNNSDVRNQASTELDVNIYNTVFHCVVVLQNCLQGVRTATQLC